MKRRLLCGASALSAIFAAGLVASPAIAADQAAPPPGAATTAPPAAAASDNTTIGELVVTAEKRTEKLESVGEAVSAYSRQQRDLVGIQSVQDLTDFTPGLAYSAVTNRPYMRGVGRNTDNLATESAVAVYVDNVYYGANASTILQQDSLFVDRIDVERGPQSTLYGRNADGGAINYVTVRPSKEFEAEVRAGIGNYDKYYGEALISGPLSDNVRFLVGGNYTSETGGYFNNLDGKPEGGSVAQGDSGTSYFGEAQLEANVGDHLDLWGKAATGDFNVNYHTTQLLGPLAYPFTTPEATLQPNSFYALCFLPASQGGVPGAAGCPTSITPTTQVVVPGSIVTLSHIATTNVSNSNIRNFIQDVEGSNDQTKDIALAFTATYHMPTFDIKYTGGYQSFFYNLNFPTAYGSGVESYALQGPSGLGNLQINDAKDTTRFVENEQFFSHELDFQSTDTGPVQWIGGLYWYHEYYEQPVDTGVQPDQTQLQNPVSLALAPTPANPLSASYLSDTTLTEDSYAGFAQVDWKLNDQFKITAGARYTSDHKSGDQEERVISFDTIAPFTVNTFGAATPAVDITSLAVAMGKYRGAGIPFLNIATGFYVRDLNATWGAWTGTAALDWTPDSTTLAYIKYDRGYKTGGFSTNTIAADPETNPEYVDAYEIGLKKTISRTFQANVAAFMYNYQDDQQPLEVPVTDVGDVLEIVNIPNIRTYGVELETIWRPIDDLSLSLNYSYLNSKVTNAGPTCYEDTVDPLAQQPGANACAGQPGLQTLKGETPPETPPNKVTLNALYTFHFDPGNLTLSGTYIWKDATYGSIFNRPYDLAPAYSQVNLRATWTDAKKRYTVIAFVDNLFNTVGYDGASGNLGGYGAAGNEIIESLIDLTAPRTFGLELQYRFQ